MAEAAAKGCQADGGPFLHEFDYYWDFASLQQGFCNVCSAGLGHAGAAHSLALQELHACIRAAIVTQHRLCSILPPHGPPFVSDSSRVQQLVNHACSAHRGWSLDVCLQEKKRAKMEARRAPDLHPPVADPHSASARKVTTEIQKNRGLTPHRRKDIKNPRKHARIKFAAAEKRRKGSVVAVRKPEGPYGGEATGIKAKLSKSVRFG